MRRWLSQRERRKRRRKKKSRKGGRKSDIYGNESEKRTGNK